MGEEFGFIGSIALLMLFAIVIFYGVRIAMASRSQFGRLLAMGITLNFFFYIMINAAMVMGLIPVVGIPMPLISYGGTAMLTVMFGFGLLMSRPCPPPGGDSALFRRAYLGQSGFLDRAKTLCYRRGPLAVSRPWGA